MSNAIPTTTAADTEQQPLAARIRAATDEAHRAAETTPFVQDLMGGRLPLTAYAELAAQHQAIYAVLEAAVAANTDPDVAPFLAPELTQMPSLLADLAFLAGPDWASHLRVHPATVAYCDHLRTACAEWSGGLLAHHYVRYLGDLSGGRLVRGALQRIYDLTDDRGTEFYRFPAITSPKAFKERYRSLLDGLGWDEAERRKLIDEVIVAYHHNAAVFADLGG